MPDKAGNQEGTKNRVGLKPGAMIDHYRIVRPLGAGGMAEVYLARDTKLGRKVALKIIQPKRIGKKDFVERFLFEAKATAKFSHPHIVTIHGVGETDNGPYLALEYLEGQTLRERLEHERLSVRESMRIGKEIADALCAAHRKKIIHRDLKPENIMLGKDGRLRVLDFGLSCLLGTQEEIDPAEDDQQTVEKPFVSNNQGIRGTPRYIAPEQWRKEEIDSSTDIWALGLILYEMLVGKHPFDKVDSLRDLASLVSGPQPVPLPVSEGHISFDTLRLLENCLAKDPDERLAAQEVVLELEQQLAGGKPEDLIGMNPFRGLLSFEEEHSSLYFGRETEVAAFVEKLRSVPILPVIGPSGAGKSSFVKAGVIPRLREKGPLILIHLRPGRDPFLSLASGIVAAWRQPTISTGSLGPMGSMSGLQNATTSARESIGEPKELSAQLYEHPYQLNMILHRLAERRRSYVVLFVDQLEELCAVEQKHGMLPRQSEASGEELAESVLGRFMQGIAHAADDPKMPVRVVLTLREEFFTRLVTSKKVREALDQIMLLRKPSQETLVTILERTVKAVGYKFEEFYLPHELVDDVKREQACLPLLQFACQVMWQNRDEQRKVLTSKSYRDMDGVTGALVQHAEGVLTGLTPQEVSLTKRILLRLVTEDKTRRIMNHKELLQGLHDEAQGVLERLVESRLVTIRRKIPKSQEGPSTTQGDGCAEEEEEGECELVHEALVSNWKRLNNWIDENIEEIGLLNQLEQAARLWDRRGRRIDDLWKRQALEESAIVLEQAISRGTRNADFVASCESQARKARFKLVLIFGFVIVALIASAWLGNHFLQGQLCTGAEEKVGSVWNEQVKQAISKSFLATGSSYAKDTVVRLTKILDNYTNGWAIQYTQACEATHGEGEQSEEVLDLRMGCLKKRMGEVNALLKVFAKADSEVVKKAVQASASLTGVTVCADQEALRATYPPPKTEKTKSKVAMIRGKLNEVDALEKTGKYQQGLSLVQKLATQANAVDYQPVQAEVMYQLGKLLTQTGDYKKAEVIFHKAARLAGACQDALLTTKAIIMLVMVVGSEQARHKEGLLFAREAEVLLSLSGGDERSRSLFFNHLGKVYYGQGEYDRALECHRKSLAIDEKLLGSENPLVADSLNEMGNVLNVKGEYDKAIECHRKAHDIREKVLGPEHPAVAQSLTNMGLVSWNQGNYEKALEYSRRALEIKQNVLGLAHPDVADSLNNLGIMSWNQDKSDQALDFYQRALSIREKALGSEHPLVAEVLNNMAAVFMGQGNKDKASQCYLRSLAIYQKALGSQHPNLAYPLINLGDVFRSQGQYDKANKYLRQALSIWEHSFGPEHPLVALSLSFIGDTLLSQGKQQLALQPLERAAAICKKETCEPKYYRAGLFSLARAIVATSGDKERAIKLAKQARELCSKTSRASKKELEEINTWLQKQGAEKLAKKAIK